MSFDMPADAYDAFMGRWSTPVARQLLDLVSLPADESVLDVGCGPGILTAELVDRQGLARVSAIDPSPPFVAAVRDRFPGLDVREGGAEVLPWADDTFDHALAQLVVHFMSDPVAGLREMARVTRAGGVVGATVWDHAGDRSPLRPFWEGIHLADPGADRGSRMAGADAGALAALFVEAGLTDVTAGELTASRRFATFEEWWTPFEHAAGPARLYLDALDDAGRARVREACRSVLPPAPFDLEVVAWYALGRA